MYNKVSPANAPSNNPKDYLAIAAYGEWTHSASYYIKQEQESACKQKQPINVICEIVQPGGVRTGRWRTLDTIVNPHTRYLLEKRIEEMKEAQNK